MTPRRGVAANAKHRPQARAPTPPSADARGVGVGGEEVDGGGGAGGIGEKVDSGGDAKEEEGVDDNDYATTRSKRATGATTTMR